MDELALLDALLRLHLELKREGRSLTVTGASPELIDLIEFAGCAGVLSVEPAGEPPERE
ncbi:MAG TPA: hypothetical protein VF134_05695 [Candidatus Dormibacteraeota bacterium]